MELSVNSRKGVLNKKPILKPNTIHQIKLDLLGKKINLIKLNNTLIQTNAFIPHLDYDTNPRQNYLLVDIKPFIYFGEEIKGNVKIFSNGTIVTTINTNSSHLINFFSYFQTVYVGECLE